MKKKKESEIDLGSNVSIFVTYSTKDDLIFDGVINGRTYYAPGLDKIDHYTVMCEDTKVGTISVKPDKIFFKDGVLRIDIPNGELKYYKVKSRSYSF